MSVGNVATLAGVVDVLIMLLVVMHPIGLDGCGLMLLLLMLDLHVDDGVNVDIGIDDNVEAGILFTAPSWPVIDGWSSMTALGLG